MRKDILLTAIVSSGIGAITGFFIGYKLKESKIRKECDERLDREIAQLHSEEYVSKEDYEEALTEAFEAGKDAQQKHDYESMLSDMRYKIDEDAIQNNTEEASDSESKPDDNDDISNDEITVTKEKPKVHKNPKILGVTQFDDEDPDTKYPRKDVYYFMNSDLLTDNFGAPVEETDAIGNDLRNSGWMNGLGSIDATWVRNYDREVDYYVHRKKCAVEDQFGTEEQDE